MGPSSPYYLFGGQRRYPFAWHGGAGGVPWSQRAAETRELSGGNLEDSGIDRGLQRPYPAFGHSQLHNPAITRAHGPSLGDWPLVRPAGPEPLDPHSLAGILDLSSNEKIAAIAVAGFAAWWFLIRKKRNPGHAATGKRGAVWDFRRKRWVPYRRRKKRRR